MRLNQLARHLQTSPEKIVEFLQTKDLIVENKPNVKLSTAQLDLATAHFKKGEKAATKKEEIPGKPQIVPTRIVIEKETPANFLAQKAPQEEPPQKEEKVHASLKVLGKIELPKEKKKSDKVSLFLEQQKKKRRSRISQQMEVTSAAKSQFASTKPSGTSYRPARKPVRRQSFDRTRRKAYREQKQERLSTKQQRQIREKILQVTEFISAHDLAPLLGVPVTDVLDICLSLGMEVSINQRLNREAISLIAEEIGQKIEFITLEEKLQAEEVADRPEDLQPIAPVVSVMGHVDHGKTSLLDYIRKTKVIAKEAGGITQHIGAYNVPMKDGKRIVFLDTPGHEAFTAMRARGADITNVAIIIIAANDGVKPQTKEAISHAQLAGLPIVIALNKIDHPEANVESVKTELSQMNILVEDWGGKYQCQAISAKTGEGIEDLLEKVILEADILELKANPKKQAKGTVIEAELKKGQGYIATVLVQEGTLKKGDILVAGSYFGKVKALFDAQKKTLKEAGPATPVQILGLDGAPPAGQVCRVMASDREARNLANRYKTILQEQRRSAQHGHALKKKEATLFSDQEAKGITLLIKGDVSGSVEALADSLMGLSTEEINVQIIYKAVGPITESDVLLASTSGATIVAFQTKVTPQAVQAQKQEGVTITQHKIIYEAIDDVKKRLEALEEPEEKLPTLLGKAEVRKIFKISRIGTIAGCFVKEGIIKRNETIKILRDGELLYEGPMKQLKREKEVIKSAKADTECGISADGFNDIKEGDVIECWGIEE